MTPYRSRPKTVYRIVVAGTAAVVALGLSACGGGDKGTSNVSNAKPSVAASTADVATMVDPWVKTAESGMSAIFGMLRNDTAGEVTVVSATSSISPVELHEVTMADGKMSMRQKEGGFSIPARGSHELKPGGDHLMLMSLAKPVKAGDQVEVTLTFKDGKTMKFTAVAKPFAGGNENYEGGMTHAPASHG